MTDILGTQDLNRCDECRWTAAGGHRGPLTDDEYAEWVLVTCGPAETDRLAEMYKALAGSDGWRRQPTSGYTLHAIRRQNAITCIVIGDETGWRWQVWRDGDHRAVRSIQGPSAPSAAAAVALAGELAAAVNRRHRSSTRASKEQP